MLQLKNISKIYQTGELKQKALDKVTLNFRRNEFVSILGPSGSGKTTLLNIIGGLDRYTDGDLKINGKSTKQFKDRDWDAYRNNSIGFVFQSYNLIGHQSVLANVELALTLAGVSRKERKQRAKEALTRVGLADHIHKRPNQLSGGQMQRVAIARALVNNPEILLADEPTGALDTETSTQIMELLKEIARDRLVIMVTHNPELARKYSTRIVRLLDGKLITDSNPYEGQKYRPQTKPRKKARTTMSFFTALGLSLNNLGTKMGRTLLTAFAGSIGIIGIALILSLSNGIQTYINQIQQETLASYPINITQEEDPFMAFFQMGQGENTENDGEAVYVSQQLINFFNRTFVQDGRQNNLTDFKTYLDESLAQTDPPQENNDLEPLSDLISTIQYQYKIPMNTYVKESPQAGDPQDGYRTTDLGQIVRTPEQQNLVGDQSMNFWSELIPEKDGQGISQLIYDQYELVEGAWPQAANEILVVLDEHNQIPDAAFFSLGLISEAELRDIMRSADTGESVEVAITQIDYQDLLDIEFKLLLNGDFFVENPDGTWRDIRLEEQQFQLAIEDGLDLTISGIIRPKEDSNEIIRGSFAYTNGLTQLLIDQTQNQPIVQAQLEESNENTDVISGLPFEISDQESLSDQEKADEILAYFQEIDPRRKSEIYQEMLATPTEEELNQAVDQVMAEINGREDMITMAQEAFELSQEQAQEFLEDFTDQELEDFMTEIVTEEIKRQYDEAATGQVFQIKSQAVEGNPFGMEGDMLVADVFDQRIAIEENPDVWVQWYDQFMPNQESDSTLADNLDMLGMVSQDAPSAINIYADSFEDKEDIDAYISAYNEGKDEEDQIQYTDYVGLIMSGVTTMINAVTYGLIAFVSISLIVSSIMIGIITYISVLERTKEIGILRSIGASKGDVSRVFNAETVIVGFFAGLIGIGVTLLLNIPINIIMENITGIPNISILPPIAGIILVALSMFLTIIAGLIPSRMAAKQDPVEALRSE